MDAIPRFFTIKHYAFAFYVFLTWSYLVYSKDHILGCPESHGFMYNTHLHLFTLTVYMISHAVVIHQVERINKPTEFAISKMGTVLILLRQIKFFLLIRVGLICAWLYMVFYLNAEETYIPVICLICHLALVIYFIYYIKQAVKTDNDRLPSHRDKFTLSRAFHVVAFFEITCAIMWLMFNIADVHYCHYWYEWNIRW